MTIQFRSRRAGPALMISIAAATVAVARTQPADPVPEPTLDDPALTGVVDPAQPTGPTSAEPLAPEPSAPEPLTPGTDAPGDPDLQWNTIDSGGLTYMRGDDLSLGGTVGQPDTGNMIGGLYTVQGGFWPGVGAPQTCYSNCDGSTVTPLSPADFTCFLAAYRAGAGLSYHEQVTAYANCDGSTVVPTLSPADFTCFLAKYRAGCPN